MSLDIVILAAGQGTRMRSALPKVLHEVAGKSMLGHVIDTARALAPRKIHVVIGHGAEQVRQRLAAEDIHFVLQAEQLGTGHAVAQAMPQVDADKVLILYGDVPLTRVETLAALLQQVGHLELPVLDAGAQPVHQQHGLALTAVLVMQLTTLMFEVGHAMFLIHPEGELQERSAALCHRSS